MLMTQIFYVVSGTVEVTIYKTTFEVKTGAQFYVPEGKDSAFIGWFFVICCSC